MNKRKYMVIDVEFVCEGKGSLQIIPKGANPTQTYWVYSSVPGIRVWPLTRLILPHKDFDIKVRGKIQDFSIKKVGVIKKDE